MANKPFQPSLIAKGAGFIYGGLKAAALGAENAGKRVVNSYLEGFASEDRAKTKQGLDMIGENFGTLNNYQKTLAAPKKKKIL